MDEAAAAGGAAADRDLITVHVKFSGRTLPVTLSSTSTVRDLKSLLLPLTDVLLRGQKLIFKGKVLDDTATLESSKVSNGSKIMLIASQGLHQGGKPITQRDNVSSNLKTTSQSELHKTKPIIDRSRWERWKITKIVALSECQLEVIPKEVWTYSSFIRVLDISKNSIKEVPEEIGSVNCLEKLLLDANDISDESISWKGVTSLKFLKVLSLNQNQLTTIPATLGALTSLTQLHVANNNLTSLPDEIGLLSQLQVLRAAKNRISSVASSIGNCYSLIEVDFSSNLVAELPETFGNLQNLKALHLSKNGLKSLPSTLFKKCLQLSTLDLHGTEITNNILRQLEGWEDFDERRRLKSQKQLDFRVESSAGFDEGADEDNGRW
ncbi:LRR repeats and ubiquitin-like domain-containing protein [Acorus calamus]|uniref:LRR repeats and ubiquitin-like domain-containing protein n=1 Tax=Acorus calamus TaxID=4465 RepID=A0AAV9C3D6_ACOCL|nr:LRR repeats and ubiquitin-like domain-containing protein [Acorus calamus]